MYLKICIANSYDITEILLKVVLNTINLSLFYERGDPVVKNVQVFKLTFQTIVCLQLL
jgi:hypothetical protein